MALIKCPECGKEISDKVKACPNCGYPMKKRDKRLIILIASVLLFLIAGSAIYLFTQNLSNDKKESKPQKVEKPKVSASVDPREADYQKGIEKLKKGDAIYARSYFEKCGDYKDSKEYLDKVGLAPCYKNARKAIQFLYDNAKNPQEIQIYKVSCYSNYVYIDWSGQNGFGGMDRSVDYFKDGVYLDKNVKTYINQFEISVLSMCYEDYRDVINKPLVYDKEDDQAQGTFDTKTLKEILPKKIRYIIK